MILFASTNGSSLGFIKGFLFVESSLLFYTGLSCINDVKRLVSKSYKFVFTE